jgi:GT2 family glycosyltransferase
MAGVWEGDEGMMRALEEPPTETSRVDAVGAGFVIVRRDVWEAIDGHWFDYEHYNGRQLGEDVAFCHKVADAGFEILLDPRVRLAHLKVMEVHPDSLTYQYRH